MRRNLSLARTVSPAGRSAGFAVRFAATGGAWNVTIYPANGAGPLIEAGLYDAADELLLIGENTTYGELLSRLPVAERLLRRKINPNLYSVDDFQRRLREEQPFILKMLSERKVFVLGDDTDLDNIIKEVHPEEGHGDALHDV